MKKNVLALLITATVISACAISLGLTGCNSDGNSNGTKGLEYTLNDAKTGYIVSGIGTATATDVVIPAEYDGKPVTSIGESAFYQCSNLTSVTIPDGVTSIGEYAFYDCGGLTSITIGNSVASIGDFAFYNCSGFTSITIPDGVTDIGSSAFNNCGSLTGIVIPDSVTSIGNYAFNGCRVLASVYFNGAAEDWDKIDVSANNTYLTNATLYYYSEEEPTDDGKYWRYVDGEIVVWEKEN